MSKAENLLFAWVLSCLAASVPVMAYQAWNDGGRLAAVLFIVAVFPAAMFGAAEHWREWWSARKGRRP